MKLKTYYLACREHTDNIDSKMIETKNGRFLLAGDKFMPEMHLKQTGFTYSACGPFTKNKQRI